MTSRVLRALALLGLGFGACTQSGYTVGVLTPSTAVVVDPAEFLGAVTCVDAPGGMRRYVATLVDVSPLPLVADAGSIVLPSSAPTECWRAVHFERITIGRDYVADIDGYDRTDIRPLSPGSRIQVDAEGAYVAPRWTTSCGRMAPLEPSDGGTPGDAATGDAGREAAAAPTPVGADGDAGDAGEAPSLLGRSCTADEADAGDASVRPGPSHEGPTCSALNATVVVRDCAPLVDSSGAPPRTGLSVDMGALPGVTACGGDAGIASFTVRLLGSTEPRRAAACGDRVTFEGLTGGSAYTVEVTALDASGQAAGLTTCFRRAVSGLVLPASCDPLVSVP